MPDHDGARLVKYRGVWCAYWRESGRPRRLSLGVQDKGAAERLFQDWQVARSVGRPITTVGDALEVYLRDKLERAKTPREKVYAKALRSAWEVAAKAKFGNLRPDQVTRDLCLQYAKERMAKGCSSATPRKELSVLQAGLRWRDKNTPAIIEMPPPPPARTMHLTRDQFHKLLEAAAAPHIKLFMILAVTTAARPSALLELTWDRVDFDRGRIDMGKAVSATKGRTTVPMNESARAALVAAREAASTDYVIEYSGEPVSSVKKAFAAACRRAGLKGVTPYTLRHTAGVWMVEAGVPMGQISQYMGHTSSRVTERVYAVYSPEFLAQPAAALEISSIKRVQLGTGTSRKSASKSLT